MSDTRVFVDFEKGRGFGPMGTGLPENYLSGDRVTVLSTIAAIYLHPDPTRANMMSQAVTMLALYGAGAGVRLNAEQYMQLEAQAEEYQATMRSGLPGYKSNESLVHCVRHYAEQRFAHESTAAPAGLVDVSFAGWGHEGLIGSPEDLSFFDHLLGFDRTRLAEALPALAPLAAAPVPQRPVGDTRGELLTAAFLCTNPDHKLVYPLNQAISLLALYGAGAQISLTGEQYAELDAQAAEYEFTGTEMCQVATFVREHAARRFKTDRVSVQ